MKKICYSLLILIASLISAEESFAATKYISIGTGAPMGVYYPAGGSICRLINRGRKGHGIRCSVEPTDGSSSNLEHIDSGENDFGIVQSDWKYHAYNVGIKGKNSVVKPFKELRSVFSLYTETFSLAVLEKSDIKTLDDIIGKVVNFGPKDSGMYATMETLSGIKGWTKESFSDVQYLKPSEQIGYLCKGKIDVMIYVSGNPNGVLQEATQSCKVRIISIDAATIDSLIKANPFYVKAIIPGGIYAGNPNDIETFGVQASVVTSEKVSADVVYTMVKVVFENFDNFKTLHPVFSSLKKEDMARTGTNSAPFHQGALRYFREAKLLKAEPLVDNTPVAPKKIELIKNQ
jgi:TRAP transporter TAXI family solute receptor